MSVELLEDRTLPSGGLPGANLLNHPQLLNGSEDQNPGKILGLENSNSSGGGGAQDQGGGQSSSDSGNQGGGSNGGGYPVPPGTGPALTQDQVVPQRVDVLFSSVQPGKVAVLPTMMQIFDFSSPALFTDTAQWLGADTNLQSRFIPSVLAYEVPGAERVASQPTGTFAAPGIAERALTNIQWTTAVDTMLQTNPYQPIEAAHWAPSRLFQEVNAIQGWQPEASALPTQEAELGVVDAKASGEDRFSALDLTKKEEGSVQPVPVAQEVAPRRDGLLEVQDPDLLEGTQETNPTLVDISSTESEALEVESGRTGVVAGLVGAFVFAAGWVQAQRRSPNDTPALRSKDQDR